MSLCLSARNYSRSLKWETVTHYQRWCNNNVSRIWSIARLTKRAASLINLSIAQHLTNCAIFDQSRSALAIGLGVRLELGLGSGLGLVLSRVRLWLGLGLRNWPNAQRVWSNAHIDQMRLTIIIIIIIIIEVFWTQDVILYVQVMVLETELFFITTSHAGRPRTCPILLHMGHG